MPTSAPRHEMKATDLVRDTRPIFERISYWLFQPSNFLKVLAGLAVAQVLCAALWPVWLGVVLMLFVGISDKRFKLPLRMPKDIAGVDHSNVLEFDQLESKWFGLYKKTVTKRIPQPAGGILYWGYQRSQDPWKQGQELWATNSDIRTHVTLAGTTGSGKTQALLGLVFNALCWGSGTVFTDGKAMSDLAYSLWCMCRYFGREDDVLFLSFLTGGADPFEVIAQRGGKPKVYKPFQSNSTQPFADGEASFLLQMLASLLPKASGDSAQWQNKALNMIDAVIRVLCYKRAMGEMSTSIPTIRHYLALDNLVQFYIEGRDGKLPELAYLPIKAYFETALPGFVPGLASQPELWSQEVRNQHGYLTGQFARILSMMMDSYGHIFSDVAGEIDMHDVMVNNRVLLALIPSMEKSAEEAAALGKLLVACTRLMMARNLGHQLEGSKQDVVDTKATNTPYPTPVLWDEVAYYAATGMAVQLAQARQLNMMIVLAFQDVQGLKRGEVSDEVGSLIANTKFKYCLALEDPDDTFDLFRKAGGQSAVSVIAGHDAKGGMLASSWGAQQATRIELRDRIDITELKSFDAGQGVILFKDQVVRSAAFHVPFSHTSSKVVKARINRFLQVPAPAYERLPPTAVAAEKRAKGERLASREIAAALSRGVKPYYPQLDDPVLDAAVATARHLNALSRRPISTDERAIALYETVRQRIRGLRAQGTRAPHWHAPMVSPPPDEVDQYSEL
jgi:intracellular multiplication protein IcmO